MPPDQFRRPHRARERVEMLSDRLRGDVQERVAVTLERLNRTADDLKRGEHLLLEARTRLARSRSLQFDHDHERRA